MNLLFVLHQTLFGAVAAAGFGVLFNVAVSRLPWCALSGAVALFVRTACIEIGMSLVGSSFCAAAVVGLAAHLRSRHTDMPQDVLAVVGCIPMIPGSLASKAILGLYQLVTTSAVNDMQLLFDTSRNTLLVVFTIGAIGTGLLIPMLLARLRLAR